MKIHIFEPGDATKYLYIFEHLDEDSARQNGHSQEEAVYFAFGVGTSKPMKGYTFPLSHFTDEEYFMSKWDYLNEKYA